MVSRRQGGTSRRRPQVGEEPETISVLEVSPERLATSFKKYAWVEGVKVSYSPGQIDVELRYHQPVAWVQLSTGDQIVIDEEGNILPVEDVDVPGSALEIKVMGTGLARPSDPKPGVVWKVRDGSGLERIDERIVAAAEWPAFSCMSRRRATPNGRNALRVLEIIVSDSRAGVFLCSMPKESRSAGAKRQATSRPASRPPPKNGPCFAAGERRKRLDFWPTAISGLFQTIGSVIFVRPRTPLAHQPTTKPAEKRPDPTSSSRNRQDRDNRA